MGKRGTAIRTDGPKRLRELLDTDLGFELSVEGRDGIGLKARVPWIRIYSQKHSPSANEGWYV